MTPFGWFSKLDRDASVAAREHNTDVAQVAAEYSGIIVHWVLFTLFVLAILTGLDPVTFLQTKLITPIAKAAGLSVSIVAGFFTAYGYTKGSTKLTSVFFSTLSKKNNLESVAKNLVQILMWASITLLAVPYILMVGALAIRSAIGLPFALSTIQVTGFVVFAFFMTGIFVIFPGLLRTPYTLEELKSITVYQIAESLPERLEEFSRKNPTAALRITWRAVLPDHLDPVTEDILMSLSEQGKLEIERAKIQGAQMGFSKEENQVLLGPPKR